MSKFKVGDKVTPFTTDHSSDFMKHLIGKTLVVIAIDTDTSRREVVWAKLPGGYSWRLYSHCLRLVAKAQTDSATQKPLRRGHLVKYKGKICVVISKGTDPDVDYRIASLTDTPHFFWASVDELTKIGSIRKKVKKLKAQVEDEERILTKNMNSNFLNSLGKGR